MNTLGWTTGVDIGWNTTFDHFDLQDDNQPDEIKREERSEISRR
jgi:hypothetical protein